MDSYFRQFGLKWKMWITRGLLRCFYQLSGLSFWRHPFTAEDPLVNNNIMLHFSKTVIMKKQKALEMKKRMQLLSFECHHFCCLLDGPKTLLQNVLELLQSYRLTSKDMRWDAQQDPPCQGQSTTRPLNSHACQETMPCVFVTLTLIQWVLYSTILHLYGIYALLNTVLWLH